MKKTMSILSGMALVAALGTPVFAGGGLEVEEINAAAWTSYSAIAQEQSEAKIDNSQTTTATTERTLTETTETDYSVNDSYNAEIKDNVIVEAKLVQVSANVALAGVLGVAEVTPLGGEIENKISVENAVKDFSGISNVNLSSGYFNNAGSQVTFGVR